MGKISNLRVAVGLEIAQKCYTARTLTQASDEVEVVRSPSDEGAVHTDGAIATRESSFCVRFQRWGGYLAKSATYDAHEANKPVVASPGIFSTLRYGCSAASETASLLSKPGGVCSSGYRRRLSMTKI